MDEKFTKVKVVVFELRSEYYASRTEIKNEKTRYTETTIIDPKKLELRSFRVGFYRWLQANAYKTPMGWFLFKDYDQDKLTSLMNTYERLLKEHDFPGEPIQIIDVFIPRDVKVKFLHQYLMVVESKIEELEVKLDIEPENKQLIREKVKFERIREKIEKELR